MADLNAIADALSGLTPGEAGQLSEIVQDRWGVKINDTLVPAPTTTPAPQQAVEQTEFTVTLRGFEAAKKMEVIKAVRPITGLGLKEAKEFVETAPHTVKEGLSRAEADAIAKTLTDAGGGVTIS
jgi:large subunit ribosomal protein L7/L12